MSEEVADKGYLLRFIPCELPVFFKGRDDEETAGTRDKEKPGRRPRNKV